MSAALQVVQPVLAALQWALNLRWRLLHGSVRHFSGGFHSTKTGGQGFLVLFPRYGKYYFLVLDSDLFCVSVCLPWFSCLLLLCIIPVVCCCCVLVSSSFPLLSSLLLTFTRFGVNSVAFSCPKSQVEAYFCSLVASSIVPSWSCENDFLERIFLCIWTWIFSLVCTV